MRTEKNLIIENQQKAKQDMFKYETVKKAVEGDDKGLYDVDQFKEMEKTIKKTRESTKKGKRYL